MFALFTAKKVLNSVDTMINCYCNFIIHLNYSCCAIKVFFLHIEHFHLFIAVYWHNVVYCCESYWRSGHTLILHASLHVSVKRTVVWLVVNLVLFEAIVACFLLLRTVWTVQDIACVSAECMLHRHRGLVCMLVGLCLLFCQKYSLHCLNFCLPKNAQDLANSYGIRYINIAEHLSTKVQIY